MPSVKVETNAVKAVKNVGAYLEGVASTPRKNDVDRELGQAVTNIAMRSLSRFIDQEARFSPQSLHHVYEWNQVGKPLGRLWKLDGVYRMGTIAINSQFKQSRTFVPNKNYEGKSKHKFIMKSEIMERGRTVRIRAKQANALFFYSKSGEPVFIPRSRYVVVRNPGGTQVRGSYRRLLEKFSNSGRLEVDVKESGIASKLENAMALAGNQMPMSVSSGTSAGSFRVLAETITSKHIRQIARTYQFADGDANG